MGDDLDALRHLRRAIECADEEEKTITRLYNDIISRRGGVKEQIDINGVPSLDDSTRVVGAPAADGVVFIPIPADPADAYELYEREPLVYQAVNLLADEDNVEAILRSGPNCYAVEIERLVGAF
jgi:hypothetical protein